VLAFAPRIPKRLLDALIRLDDRSVPIAETHRRLGERADQMGITRPSYQRIRELVHQIRRIRPARGPARLGLRMALRTRLRGRALEAFVAHETGVGVRRLE
jgi:hypothetical protein